MKKHSLYKIHKSKPFKFCFHIDSAITVASSNAARSPARCVMVGRGGGRGMAGRWGGHLSVFISHKLNLTKMILPDFRKH